MSIEEPYSVNKNFLMLVILLKSRHFFSEVVIVWPFSEASAHCMFDYVTKNKLILGVGCGIELISLMLILLRQTIIQK